MKVVIEPGDPRDPRATQLLESSHALMLSLFPADACHYLSIDALCTDDIHFFVARVDGQVMACGALADKSDYGEIKSIFTAPEARGLGLARRLIESLEAKAKELDLNILRLETGTLLNDAHRLYGRLGYVDRGPFGNYSKNPHSIFMEKRLA